MKIVIDENSGFCWGVVQTIEKVEEKLDKNVNESINVLGEIIHNPHEIERLASKKLSTIDYSDINKLDADKSIVIIRAHGEPPDTYKKLRKNNLKIVDATCPLVKRLQQQVFEYYNNNWQIVIYGKYNHAEVVGLRGVCDDNCIVLKTPDEVDELVDFYKKTVLFSQTTMDVSGLLKVKSQIDSKLKSEFIFKNTICKFVINREKSLYEFAKNNDLILFVAGRNSSNGKVLFDICKKANKNSMFIESVEDLDIAQLLIYKNIGITGATSTPKWYLENVKNKLNEIISKYNANL